MGRLTPLLQFDLAVIEPPGDAVIVTINSGVSSNWI